jgi:hypothetical protein
MVMTSGASPETICVVRFCQYWSQALWVILMVMSGLAFWKASAHCW